MNYMDEAEIVEYLQRLGYDTSQDIRHIIEIAINNITSHIANFDNSYNSYNTYNIILKKYKWWYFPDFPDRILNTLSNNKNRLSIPIVNKAICDYYNENNFKKLKMLVRKWKKSTYFSNQKINIKELMLIHEIGCYNSAITISLIIIEGSIRNFVKEKSSDYYRFSTVKKEFRSIVENSDEFYNDEIEIIYDKLKEIDVIFTGGFSPSNSENINELVRDKRMHGYSYKKQTEVTSLKMFHLIDELYYIMDAIENPN